MSQRLNITVSDELYERLQAVKGSMNISQVCQIAIENQVKLQEIKSMSTTAKENLIQKLKISKQEFLVQQRSEGSKFAHELIQDPDYEWSYEDFREFGDTMDRLALNYNSTDTESWFALSLDDLPEWLQDQIEGADDGDIPLYKDLTAFLQGVVSTLRDTWEELKAEV